MKWLKRRAFIGDEAVLASKKECMVQLSNGTKKWIWDLLSEEELDFAFRYVYDRALSFLKQKKPSVWGQLATWKEPKTSSAKQKDLRACLRKLWFENVRIGKLRRLFLKLGEFHRETFRNRNKEWKEKDERKYWATFNCLKKCREDKHKLKTTLLEQSLGESSSAQSKRYKRFWVENSKKFLEMIEEEYKKQIKKNRNIEKEFSKTDGTKFLKGLVRERVAEFFRIKLRGNEEVVKMKLKELEVIGQMAVLDFKEDLVEIRKAVESNLEEPRSKWQKAKELGYPIGVVAVVELIRKCNGQWPWQ